MEFKDLTIGTFLDHIARPSPIWAAGSALAITCAEAWALIEMIAGLAKHRYPSLALEQILNEGSTARNKLSDLAHEDAAAVDAMIHQCGPDSDDMATDIPLQVLTWAIKGSQAARHPALIAYAPAALDLACAVSLLDAVTTTTRTLVMSNLARLDDQAQSAFRDRLAALDEEGAES